MNIKIITSLVCISLLAVSVSAQEAQADNGRGSSEKPIVTSLQPTTTSPLLMDVGPDIDGPQLKTIVVPEDQVVQGSLAVGFDSPANPSFGFNTILLTENNLRIYFDDSSISTGYPNNDWVLIANDSQNGGKNYFAIQDATNVQIPFMIMAEAPDNSIYVKNNGYVGFKTDNPITELHTSDGDTPALRLEQTGASGWTPQTWDVAGNESNFFIRDVTNGSKLPFRIKPGAPTNSIFINPEGNVGLNTTSPNYKLHVQGNIKTDSVLKLSALNTIKNPELGDIWLDGNDSILKYYNGNEWYAPGINTDNQNLNNAHLSGKTLNIGIEGGTAVSVDLSPLVDDLTIRLGTAEAKLSDSQSLLSATEARLTDAENELASTTSLLGDVVNQLNDALDRLSDAEARLDALEASTHLSNVNYDKNMLLQNTPNPAKGETRISFFILPEVKNATLVIYDAQGKLTSEHIITERGTESNIVVTDKDYKPGIYFYSLIVDGVKHGTRSMLFK
jgi:hypothetical protein